MTEADYKSFLRKLYQNLNILKERQAKYLDNPPLGLLNYTKNVTAQADEGK